MENKIKTKIIKRLHKTSGFCVSCGKKGCGHHNTILKGKIHFEEVLKAINLNEHFYKEE